MIQFIVTFKMTSGGYLRIFWTDISPRLLRKRRRARSLLSEFPPRGLVTTFAAGGCRPSSVKLTFSRFRFRWQLSGPSDVTSLHIRLPRSLVSTAPYSQELSTYTRWSHLLIKEVSNNFLLKFFKHIIYLPSSNWHFDVGDRQSRLFIF